jgi:hypothetical protein
MPVIPFFEITPGAERPDLPPVDHGIAEWWWNPNGVILPLEIADLTMITVTPWCAGDTA